MDQLAILGGKPVLDQPLAPYNSIGAEEAAAAARVMRSGCLSGFYGNWGKEFLGGPVVRAFEAAWRERFGTRHAVSVNSATSGLYAAVGAVGVGPGDEVIVPPYTMSATALAPLIYGGIPVFVDINPGTFCLDVNAVRAALTPRTRAILAVNLFGHPAPLAELRKLADERDLWLIEDNAQGLLASENGRLAGTVGHIGVFSLNYHKHIHAGEGGMCVTDDDDLALRLQLIRNHGENAVEALGMQDIANIVGFNYRLSELAAAVGLEQLRKIETHVGRRVELAERLTAGVRDLVGITPPAVRADCRHAYYVWAIRLDAKALGVSRRQFSDALTAEGFPHAVGYVRPLYRLPVFQKRVAFGSDGYPFTQSAIDYTACRCPVTERMHYEELLFFENCAYDVDGAHADLLVNAICKVHRHRARLGQLAHAA